MPADIIAQPLGIVARHVGDDFDAACGFEIMERMIDALVDRLLGRNGLLNQTLQNMGLIDEPLEFLLFSDFAVILAMVHLFTLFMVVPIFNTMMRIDRSLIEAARDGGASGLQILWNVIIPLTKPGIAIGSIFIVTLVMGDFVTTRFMSGGQSASVGTIISNQMGLLQYPGAAANAVILLIIVLVMIGAILRFVNIRKEL